MIIPRLAVADLLRSIAFYRDRLGFTLTMSVGPGARFEMNGVVDGATFATVEWNGAQLMLQDAAAMRDELQGNAPAATTSVIYLRGYHPSATPLDDLDIVKGPELTWYGMNEVHIRDPDGHILCLGAPGGSPPDS